jgi:hypothetical protein
MRPELYLRAKVSQQPRTELSVSSDFESALGHLLTQDLPGALFEAHKTRSCCRLVAIGNAAFAYPNGRNAPICWSQRRRVWRHRTRCDRGSNRHRSRRQRHRTRSNGRRYPIRTHPLAAGSAPRSFFPAIGVVPGHAGAAGRLPISRANRFVTKRAARMPNRSRF